MAVEILYNISLPVWWPKKSSYLLVWVTVFGFEEAELGKRFLTVYCHQAPRLFSIFKRTDCCFDRVANKSI